MDDRTCQLKYRMSARVRINRADRMISDNIEKCSIFGCEVRLSTSANMVSRHQERQKAGTNDSPPRVCHLFRETPHRNQTDSPYHANSFAGIRRMGAIVDLLDDG